ncbi:hypothetical protein Theam_1778 (plasmid) [Thermovibrio ammonificans HB-1]|uniref:Uncharacterized protein n=1 Tax=Thermovibrio ammonificans (strain DSM 15698 / JCM 12110 / HB-1) TaxID=648996 RepID=E8T713_THEA1|nr:hypothetical protein [Thermovibrio ammonificans]ADU97734.1 hypothetical protein Theam_1778 [Thermovibrio ammonificans HB-1]
MLPKEEIVVRIDPECREAVGEKEVKSVIVVCGDKAVGKFPTLSEAEETLTKEVRSGEVEKEEIEKTWVIVETWDGEKIACKVRLDSVTKKRPPGNHNTPRCTSRRRPRL